jgi:conjugative transposon TraN protein
MNHNILFFLSVIFPVCVNAQSTDHKLEVTFYKTTSIVFDYPVVSVDRGSRSLLAQKVKGTENAVQIKAANKGFYETNLTVFTSDGVLHHFLVSYAEHPNELTHFITSAERSGAAEVHFNDGCNARELRKLCERITYKETDDHIRIRARFRIKLKLKGIYIKDDLVFYHLGIANRSNIGYDVESLRFYVRDQKQSRRTARQEHEIKPVYLHNYIPVIAGNSEEEIIYTLSKFTIPNAKRLDIELYERNGGRNLTIPVRNREIIRARNITK